MGRQPSRPRRSGVAPAFRALAVALLGSAAALAAPGPEARPSVLLITVDTLRPDALGWVGGRNSTPNLDRLAAAGRAFPGAVSPAPLTLPTHASILTGLLPRNHGLRDNGQVFASSARTLAERFREQGYATAAFVSGFPLARQFGLDRGFDLYDDEMTHGVEGYVERRAAETSKAAAAWLGKATRPWFIWVHYYDPHDPYDPPRTFWQPGPRGAYDGEVAYTDHAIGALLAAADRAAGEDLLTVATSDHGEALGEHSEKTHGYFVYDSTMLVPLIFHWPGRVGPGRSDLPVRLVDIAATIAELTGLPGGNAGDGVSLVPTLRGKPQSIPPAYLETRLPYLYFGWSPLRALRTPEWKLVAAPRPELYGLTADPGETRNRYDQERPVVNRLAGELRAVEARPAATAGAAADSDSLARLRSLGYLAAGESGGEAIPAGLADPKDRIELRDLLTDAESAMRGGDVARARQLFEKALTQEPDNRSAVLRLGTLCLRTGDMPGALAHLDKAVRLDPGRAEARFAYGDALMRAGQFDRAAEQWAGLARLQPRRFEAWVNLGTALRQAGKPAEALHAYEAALQIRPGDAEILVEVGLAERERGDREAAAKHLGQAWAAGGVTRFRAPGTLGLALLDAGRPTDATPWLERAEPRERDFVPARVALARIKASAGDLAGARRALDEALARRPALADELRRDAQLAPLLP